MTLIDLLFIFLFIIVIGYAAHYIITTFFPAPFHMPALLIVGVLLLIFLLSQFSGTTGNYHLYHFYR